MSNETTRDSARLVLADGTVFEGRLFGARGRAVGELVFATATTGYQEVLTDPSYFGQIVTMTAPQIGNVGVNAEDAESVGLRPHAAGFVVREVSAVTSNWRTESSLEAYLAKHGTVGITEVDTRTLACHLRDHGAQNGAIGTDSVEVLLQHAKEAPSMAGLDLVQYVTPKVSYTWNTGGGIWSIGEVHPPRHRVVVVDCGIKRNILRCLVDAGCALTVVPAFASAEEILALRPDGVFLSNGPGDPSVLSTTLETVRQLLGKTPLFGICLGHQILALALGAKTYKLPFGHHGINQPVQDCVTKKVAITAQNHGFCVDEASLPSGVVTTHVHLNDGTNEGIAAPHLNAWSVQFHPEAAAGPHDALGLFDRFRTQMERGL